MPIFDHAITMVRGVEPARRLVWCEAVVAKLEADPHRVRGGTRVLRAIVSSLRWETGASPPFGIAGLALMTGMEVSSVKIALARLRELGYLVWEPVPDAQGASLFRYAVIGLDAADLEVGASLTAEPSAYNLVTLRRAGSPIPVDREANGGRGKRTLARVRRLGIHLTELQIQRAVVQHLMLRGVPGLFWFAVPNGGWRSKPEAALLKGAGVIPGVPDICAVWRGKAYGLELKIESGRLTEIQCHVHDELRAAGAIVATGYGLNHALAILKEWNFLQGESQIPWPAADTI